MLHVRSFPYRRLWSTCSGKLSVVTEVTRGHSFLGRFSQKSTSLEGRPSQIRLLRVSPRQPDVITTKYPSIPISIRGERGRRETRRDDVVVGELSTVVVVRTRREVTKDVHVNVSVYPTCTVHNVSTYVAVYDLWLYGFSLVYPIPSDVYLCLCPCVSMRAVSCYEGWWYGGVCVSVCGLGWERCLPTYTLSHPSVRHSPSVRQCVWVWGPVLPLYPPTTGTGGACDGWESVSNSMSLHQWHS